MAVIYNEMPWGELLTMEINERYLIQQLMIRPTKKTPLLYHKSCDINLIILSGYGLIDKPNSFNLMQHETFSTKEHFYLEHNSPYKITNQSDVDNLIVLKTIFSNTPIEHFQVDGDPFDTHYIEKDLDFPERVVVSDQFLF